MKTQPLDFSQGYPHWYAVVRDVLDAVRPDSYWEQRLHSVTSGTQGLHLAVMVEPYLNYLLDGYKTVESRFATRPIPPFGRVNSGDLLLVKQAGGPVVGVCDVGIVWNYNLDPTSWDKLRRDFADSLRLQASFWEEKRQARYATLLTIVASRRIDPIGYRKKDRRGWVVLKPSGQSILGVVNVPESFLVLFSGRIGSGKSSVSTGVAAALGWPRVSFGDYVREEASRRGLDSSRATLQAVGQSLIDAGWDKFCGGVLAQGDWQPGTSLVVDGIRHTAAVETIRSLTAPSRVVLVHLEAGNEVRLERIRRRGDQDEGSLERVESHPTEIESIVQLPGLADLLVSSDGNVGSTVDGIIGWLRQAALWL